jgi:hypothetical protein
MQIEDDAGVLDGNQEPANLADRERRRTEILDALPTAEREGYLAAHNAKMSGKPRIHIIP